MLNVDIVIMMLVHRDKWHPESVKQTKLEKSNSVLVYMYFIIHMTGPVAKHPVYD